MFPPLVVTLRETLEVSLVMGIVLGFLNRTQNRQYNYYAWMGALLGIVVSILLAWMFSAVAGGFTGQTENVYEGITMLSAAALTTWMVVWMDRQSKWMRKGIENKVATHLERNSLIGLALLTFVSVLREGIETILLLQATLVHSDSSYQLLGAVLGIVLAIGISMTFFHTMSGFSLRYFFKVTTVLLLLFSAGLFAHGVHELQEASIIPTYMEHVWDINPVVTKEGVYPVLHENGAIGGIAKGLLGYNGNPSLMEVLSYLLSMVLIVWWLKKNNRNQSIVR